MRIFVVVIDADGEAFKRHRHSGGIKGDDQLQDATGVVFRIDRYAGYTDRAVWEWMGKVEN